MATDIKVLQLHVRPLSFKLARPLEPAGGTIASWPVVLLDLHTSAGVVGVSFGGCFLPMLVKPLVSKQLFSIRRIIPAQCGRFDLVAV